MIEVRWHGRGGQGAVTSVELLAQAAIGVGKYAQGFPSFGPERRGAPVAAFSRIDDKKIKVRSGIYKPDVVIVLDSSLIGLVNVTDGLKPDGILIVNTARTPQELKKELNFSGIVATVDGTGIARKEMGVPIANTTMIGALIKMTGFMGLDDLKESVEHRFGRIAQKNLTAMKRAFEEIKSSN
ncbi:MAG: pyruvate synthase [Deltaproteobacteria bacterium HGW-Deltaproteobacteria-12]|jgi:pyruvate ferredoxin oxidoreductase gamma subunit|nr:MAG: pyruvate synthase [Deltaproteobacteria bacterium HGW-Deltaproteobacteria-12]